MTDELWYLTFALFYTGSIVLIAIIRSRRFA
jgi:hypothetical protein